MVKSDHGSDEPLANFSAPLEGENTPPPRTPEDERRDDPRRGNAEVDLGSYQEFRAGLSVEQLERLRGKVFAALYGEGGWQIVGTSDRQETLRAELLAAGHDPKRIVYDRVPDEMDSPVGTQID